MQAIMDLHPFCYRARVPWPTIDSNQVDWDLGVRLVEKWLNQNVGSRLSTWAWDDSGDHYLLGVGFRWEKHKTLFVLRWQ